MQWDDTPNAGFTTAEPWFHVNENYKKINVAAQNADKNSLLNYYRLAIGLRKKLSCVRRGVYQEYHKRAKWLYMYSMQDDRQKILVICSFSPKPQKLRIPGQFHMDRAKLILCNYPQQEQLLQPYEARVYFWN